MFITLFTQPLSEESNLSVCEECRFLPLEKAKVVYLLPENIDIVFWQINLTKLNFFLHQLYLFIVIFNHILLSR